MIYSTSARVRGQVAEAQDRPTRALVVVDGRRLPVPPRGATIGRSRDCDIVLDDAGISRPTRGDPAGRGGLDGRRPRLDQRRAPERPSAFAARSRCTLETTSSWARRRSSSNLDDDARARIGRLEVRLSRRAVPVRAVGGAQRAARPAPAAMERSRPSAGRRRQRRPPTPRACTRPRRSPAPTSRIALAAAGRRAGARTRLGDDLRHRRRPRARARRSRGDPPGGPVRLVAARARLRAGQHRRDRGPRLDQRHVPQRGGAAVAAAAAPGDRVRIGDSEFTFEVD